MERVKTNFDKVIGEGVVGRAYAGKALINGKVKPVVVKYIHDEYTPRNNTNLKDPVIVEFDDNREIRKSHYTKAIDALHALRGKYSTIKVARQEFRLDANGTRVLVSESFLKNGRTREVNLGNAPDTVLFRRSKSTSDLISFGVDLLKEGIPLHPDAFSVINGKQPFIVVRDPDTLAHGISKLEINNYLPPVDWTVTFFKKLASLHAYSGFSPKRQRELVNAALEKRSIGTEEEDLKINERRITLLRKIVHAIKNTSIPHKNFKHHVISRLETNIKALKNVNKKIKNPTVSYNFWST